MIQITKYPKLSEETIRMNTTNVSWFYTITETVSDIENTYDDNEHDVILSAAAAETDIAEKPKLFTTKVVANNANFITVCKRSCGGCCGDTEVEDQINVILTYRKQYDGSRILQSGSMYMGEQEYKIKEFNFHFVKDCYVGHCIYENK